MSIINDALKKTQVTQNIFLESGKSVRRKWITLVIFIVCAVVFSFYFLAHIDFKELMSTSASVPQTVRVRPLIKHHLILNGVFISEKFKTAMINNKMYSSGDLVDGMKIASIEYNRVKLVSDRETIILKNS